MASMTPTPRRCCGPGAQAVVMYELCSYTPTVALVAGEDVVDRVFQYAEKVAGGFRQVP